MGNIVKNPTEEKYQRVPADNKRVVESVTDRKGGKSFLLAAGFIKRVIDHREYWVINQQGDNWMNTLEMAFQLLEEKHNQFLRIAEEERRRDEKQKQIDAERTAIALKQYEDVRMTKASLSPLLPCVFSSFFDGLVRSFVFCIAWSIFLMKADIVRAILLLVVMTVIRIERRGNCITSSKEAQRTASRSPSGAAMR